MRKDLLKMLPGPYIDPNEEVEIGFGGLSGDLVRLTTPRERVLRYRIKRRIRTKNFGVVGSLEKLPCNTK